jgi:hypothetical protein
VPAGKMTGGSSAASCTCCARAAAGATVRPNTVRPPLSTIASTAGLVAASGAPCWGCWLRPGGSPKRRHSTAPMFVPTARRTAAKGGQGAGHRSVARRPDHEGPCHHRRPRAPRRHPPHARQRQRRESGARRARRRAGPTATPRRRLRLRCRRVAARAARQAHDTDHPGRRCRKRAIRHDVRRYRDRWRIEAAICRLKDFRRVGTRYDKLAANFAS